MYDHRGIMLEWEIRRIGEPAAVHVRGNGMIKRTQAPKAPSSRPPPRRRRRPVMPMVRRAARWSALLALAGLAYGGFALSRSPDRDGAACRGGRPGRGGNRVARPGG